MDEKFQHLYTALEALEKDNQYGGSFIQTRDREALKEYVSFLQDFKIKHQDFVGEEEEGGDASL